MAAWVKRAGWTTSVAVVALAGLGLGGCSKGSSECTFPSAPSGASALAYVCASGTGDGSAESSPSSSIARAVAAAKPGTAVLIAAGEYTENVAIDKPLSLIGSDGSSADAAAAEIHAPASYAVTVTAQGVLLQGLHIVSPQWAGIWLKKGADAKVIGVDIEGATIDGIVTTEAKLELRRSHLHKSVWAGVQMFGAAAGAATAIVDDNRIDGNSHGGIRLDGISLLLSGVSIHNNDINGNLQFGIGLFSAVAIVDDNRIDGTLADGQVGYGYGVVATGAASNVSVTKNTVSNSARVGVLFDAGAVGIVDDNRITGNGTPYVAEYTSMGAVHTVATLIGGGAGVWLQNGAGGTSGVHVGGNQLGANGFAGVALMGGARAIVDDNRIDGTAPGKLDALASLTGVLGDGVSVTGGATATVTNNKITNGYRSGLVLDGVAMSGAQLSGNTVTGNKFAMLLLGGASAPMDGNVFGNNATGITTGTTSTYTVLGKATVPAAAQAPQ